MKKFKAPPLILSTSSQRGREQASMSQKQNPINQEGRALFKSKIYTTCKCSKKHATNQKTNRMDFVLKWRSWVMKCISSSSFYAC